MPITGPALHLQAQLDAALDQVLDDQVRDLVSGWALGWDEVVGDLNATLEQIIARSNDGLVPASWFARSDRLAHVLALIGRKLDNLATSSQVRILRDLSSVARQAADAQLPILAAMLPDGHDVGGTPTLRALDSIVARISQQITSRHRPLSTDAYDAVRRELVRGVAVGINPRHTAQLMVDRAEGGFNGGLTRALTISRTEMVDAHRDAAAASQAVHADVLASWIWLAHLTPTTCRSCIAMNGTVHPLAEPGPLDHQQGRCSRMPKTKTWAELGIDLPEPAGVTVPDSTTFFDSLTPTQQRKILGHEGYDAWRHGEFPIEDWAARRENAGWRDSIVPAKPSDPGDAAGGLVPTTGGGGAAGGRPADGGPTRPPRPSLADMILEDPDDFDSQEWAESAWHSEMDGPFGDSVTAQAYAFNFDHDSTYVYGQLVDENRIVVGRYEREILQEDGVYYAFHHLLQLRADHQGTGFATAFNGRLFDWYRESGFERVEVTANIDVGGYTWAAAGFNFSFEEGARDTLARLATEPLRPGEDRAVIQELIDRAATHEFGTPGYPSAFEFSQAGRTPDLVGRDATWPGKRAMMGLYKNWAGVLWL